jgi:hypothetical protein
MKNNPLAWLTMREAYGDVANDVTFQNAFSRWLLSLRFKETAAAR